MFEDQNSPQHTQNDSLTELFSEYRESLPEFEPGADFMPGLWAKIEARRSFAFGLRRLARGLITAAAACSLIMGFLVARQEPTHSTTYLEMLASTQNQSAEDVSADVEIMRAVHERAQ